MKKFLFLDCDSTLCAIEGVDELAAMRGAETEAKVIDLTNDAMDGRVPIEEVFGCRLSLISPTRQMCEQVAQKYIETLSPGVEDALQELSHHGWTPVIISGGFTPVIEPLATKVGIGEVHAVGLRFDEHGDYIGFDEEAPTARNGGKPQIIAQLKKDYPGCATVMVGDGVSDLETQPTVDLFIGYGGVVAREKVKEGARHFIHSFTELPKTVLEQLKCNH
ncbi:MAG: HAD-IB family phosphatase [Verrucomicrobiota bacterium JB023]|nr:HAD-IB family phosphatase [Verrucomicrobiota bacterium JB023]